MMAIAILGSLRQLGCQRRQLELGQGFSHFAQDRKISAGRLHDLQRHIADEDLHLGWARLV